MFVKKRKNGKNEKAKKTDNLGLNKIKKKPKSSLMGTLNCFVNYCEFFILLV